MKNSTDDEIADRMVAGDDLIMVPVPKDQKLSSNEIEKRVEESIKKIEEYGGKVSAASWTDSAITIMVAQTE